MKINSQWVFYFYSLIYLLSVKNTWCVCITLIAISTRLGKSKTGQARNKGLVQFTFYQQIIIQ